MTITLVSSDGKTARIKSGYKVELGVALIQRDRLASLGKLRLFTPSEYWVKAVHVNGRVLGVRGIGISKVAVWI